jgi:hypothetical protein
MLGCLPLSCNFEDRGQVPGIAVGFTDFSGGLSTWTKSRHLVQLGAMNYVISTSTDSRLQVQVDYFWLCRYPGGSVLAACCEGSGRFQCRTSSEPESELTLRNHDPVGRSASVESGNKPERSEEPPKEPLNMQPRPGRLEVDARGRRAYRYRAEN